jgi:serine/threonine protein phosphatase PrpC
MEIRFWADTDTGRSRDHNEDNYLVDRRLRLFVVCDGIGGHAAGEVASATAIRAIQESLDDALDMLSRSRLATGGAGRREELLGHLEDAVKLANQRVFRHATSPDVDRQMGTTCSLMMLAGGRAFVAHVGDSRIYRIRDDQGEQLTDDHSLRQEMIRRGQLDEGDTFNQTDAITRAVGVEEDLQVDTFEVDVEAGDRFVLCSDGLSEYVTQASGVAELASVPDLRQVVHACIDHANRGGGKDNVTAIAVEARSGDGVFDALQLDERLHAIGQARPFRDLSGRELQAIFHAGETVEVAPGETVVATDSEASTLRVVLAGGLLVDDHRGEQQIDVGAAVGASWCLSDATAERRVQTGEDGATLFELRRDELISLIAADTATGLKVLWNTSKSIAGELNRLRRTLSQKQPSAPGEPEDETDGSEQMHASDDGPISGETTVSSEDLSDERSDTATETVKINLNEETDLS